MIYAEALRLLESEGLRVASRVYGIEGWSDSADGVLNFQVGRASAGGDELSIRRVGDAAPLPGGPVRWFQRPSLAELITLVVQAQRQVRAGASPSLFDAMLELDPL